MKPKEIGAIITAHTGILCCDFDVYHEYIEKIMERPVFTHELADKGVFNEIKEKSKGDFLRLAEWCSNKGEKND